MNETHFSFRYIPVTQVHIHEKSLKKLTNGGYGRGSSATYGMVEDRDFRYLCGAFDKYEQLVGWVCISKKRPIEIHVYVSPKHRRMGIGKELVRRANAYAKRNKFKVGAFKNYSDAAEKTYSNFSQVRSVRV